jgi:hypothetical protein
MSWRVPGQAIQVVIHDSDGGIGHYSRDQDDDGRVIWPYETRSRITPMGARPSATVRQADVDPASRTTATLMLRGPRERAGNLV